MLICPECGKESENDSKFCQSCGIIFYSVHPKTVEEAPAPETIPISSETSDATPAHRFQKPARVALLILVLSLTIYYLPAIRSWILGTSDPKSEIVHTALTNLPQFDLAIDLAEQPTSLASGDNGVIVGTRRSGSFLRIWQERNQYLKQWHRSGSASLMTWNGKEYIGYRESGFLHFFESYEFTIHEKSSFRVLDETTAPEAIGALSWDGTGYWASTRNGSGQDRGLLYRLNEDLKIINQLVSPSDRCRGLAWDGSYLWFLDGRINKIHILDVKGAQVSILQTYEIPIESAGGIAYDGKTIWISDQKKGRLLRLSPEIATSLTQKELNAASKPVKKETKEVSSSDSYTGIQNFSNDDVTVSSFSTRINSNALSVSWHLYLGHNLLARSKGDRGSFAKFTVTVDGGSLDAPIAKVFDARAGRNKQDDVPIVSSLGPGTYRVGLFVYVQYKDKENRNRILSKSIPSLRVRK